MKSELMNIFHNSKHGLKQIQLVHVNTNKIQKEAVEKLID